MKSLPFKEEHPVIPDNYLLARNRLTSSLKRSKSKPDILQRYDTVIKEQLNSGVVEMIDKRHEEQCLPGTVHCIPHKEVVKEDRATTKLRIVYDASAKSRTEPRLNDCLLSGPALTPLIFYILMRFRLHKVPVIRDLEKAFLNIEINPEERDWLRFLWIDNIKSSNPEVIIPRFTRLMFSLVCSPFIVNVTQMHLSMLSPRGGTRAYVGHLTSIAFPTLGNLTKNLGPRVGTFAFFVRRNGTKSHCPMCSSVRQPSWNGCF